MGANGTSNPLDFDELTEIIRRAVLAPSLLARLTHPILQGDLEVSDCVQLAVQATCDFIMMRSEIQKERACVARPPEPSPWVHRNQGTRAEEHATLQLPDEIVC